jgi:hypothetical protein
MIALPPGARIGTHSGPQPEHAWLVVIAPAGIEPKPSALVARGMVTALLTHDRGLHQPDARGLALAESVLSQGGVVGFAFACLADAMECSARLRKAGAE